MTPLVAYADLHAHPLVGPLIDLADEPGDTDAAAEAARVAMTLDHPLSEAIVRAVLGSEGPFTLAARQGVDPGDSRLDVAATELGRLGVLAHGDAVRLLSRHGLGGAVGATTHPRAPATTPPSADGLIGELAWRDGWQARAVDVARFHHHEGTGDLALYRVLRWVEGTLVGIDQPDRTRLDDLVGGEPERTPLLEDLAVFAAGGPANDALLYGPPGTGKSVAVRVCAATFAEQGVRLVQIERDDLDEIEACLAALRGVGPRTVLFIDDLVVDDADRVDRALRATLEGGVVARPANVLVWATSNRLNLTHDSRSGRDDDIDPAEGAAERAALAARFGRRVRFGRQDKDTYLAICRHLVERRLGTLPADFDGEAMRFAVRGHGISARTAQQFAAAYRTT
jgi:predicted AAA+ superfamily ATPase